MPQIGRYADGSAFILNLSGDSGIRVTSMTPESTTSGGHQINGAMIDPGFATQTLQGFDARPTSGILPFPYDAAQNEDPGATGSAITFAPGEEGSILKAVSLDTLIDATGRPKLEKAAVVTVVAQAPPANAFRPALSAPSKISRWTLDDLDLTILPSLTPPASVPAAPQIFERLRWPQMVWSGYRPAADQTSPQRNDADTYATRRAATWASAALMTCLDINSTLKEQIATALVQIGIDIFAAAKDAGATYNNSSGLGGIMAGHKLPLVYAAILLDDADMLEWADRDQHDIFAEDRQCVYVTQADVDTYDYISADLGMPEWMQSPVLDPSKNTRVENAAYRPHFCFHAAGQAMAMHLIPGARAAWNNPAFFDYVDRVMERTFFDGTGTLEYGRNTGIPAYDAPQFHQDMYDTYRTESGLPAIWNWP